MKKTLLFTSLASIAFITNSFAADISIAVVDAQKVIQESSAYKEISAQIEKKADVYKANATKLQESLQKKYKELESQKSVLKGEEYGKKARDFEKEVEIARETAYSESLNLDRAHTEALKALEDKLTEVVQQKAESKKFDLVMTKTNIIYSNKTFDITADVIQDLNAKLPSVTVKFDSAKLPSDKK